MIRIDNRLDDYFIVNGIDRSGVRLHNGTTSWGCVTIKNDSKQWNALRNLILNTKTTTFSFIEGPHFWNPTVEYPMYGTLEIR